jgi:hypothetical protein
MPPHDVVEIPGLHRRDERPLPRWLFLVICVVAALAVVAGGFLTLRTGEVEDQAEQLPAVSAERDAAIDSAQNLGRDVVAACARGDVVPTPDGQDLCARAAAVQSDPVPGAAVQGERGPGPSIEQIRTAVADYCAARGQCAGRPPTADEVAAAVAQYMTANPPDPGRPPTAAEIADAVATYFATNPPPEGPRGPRGAVGATGERGPGPTAEEIQAAVSAYLAENPPPRGEPGPTCVEDTHLETVQFADGRFGLACVLDEQPGPGPDPTDEPGPTSAAPTTEPDEGLLGG